MTTVLALFVLAAPADDVRTLFNDKDLAGWQTWLGVPNGAKKPLGTNDPNRVYSIVEVDGKPAIRISGETFGALTSTDEFENYHLKLEFKWGSKKWPPREKAKRDSGLLYHCVGPQGAQGNNWMRSLELQIQESDTGDFWAVAGAIADVDGVRTKAGIQFKPGGTLFKGTDKDPDRHVVKSVDAEKKSGEWNVIELYTVGQTSVHVVNGTVNMVLQNTRTIDGKPLTKGKLQLQSEGAEVFYRAITVQPLKQLPDGLLPR